MAIGCIGRLIGSSLAPEAGEALPLTRHGAFGYESSLPASRPGYWSGFLESVKDAAKYAGKSIVILGAAAAAALAMADNAYAQPIPDDFRLDPNYTNVGELDKYTSVRRVPGSFYAQPFGDVYDAEGHQLVEWMELIFVDAGTKPTDWDPCTPFLEGGQLVGQIFTNGKYDFRALKYGNPKDTPYQYSDFGIYSDKSSTHNIDEGATLCDHTTIIARRLDDNKRYECYFSSGTLADPPIGSGYQYGVTSKCDIQITDTEIPFVPTCGFHGYPYPEGDLNHDCNVDFTDFAIMANKWMDCAAPDCNNP
jgi:hypothetical protein